MKPSFEQAGIVVFRFLKAITCIVVLFQSTTVLILAGTFFLEFSPEKSILLLSTSMIVAKSAIWLYVYNSVLSFFRGLGSKLTSMKLIKIAVFSVGVDIFTVMSGLFYPKTGGTLEKAANSDSGGIIGIFARSEKLILNIASFVDSVPTGTISLLIIYFVYKTVVFEKRGAVMS